MKKLLAAFLLSAFPVASFAAGPGPFAPSEQVMKLHREIAAAKLDHLLNLTGDQARALLPILKEAIQLRDQMKAERAGHEAALVAALTAVRDDVRKTGAASESSLKALKDAHGSPQQRKEMHTKIKALREKAELVLTADQRALLKSFDPRPMAGAGGPDSEMGFGGEDRPQHIGKGHGPHGHLHSRESLRIALSPELLSLLEARASK